MSRTAHVKVLACKKIIPRILSISRLSLIGCYHWPLAGNNMPVSFGLPATLFGFQAQYIDGLILDSGNQDLRWERPSDSRFFRLPGTFADEVTVVFFQYNSAVARRDLIRCKSGNTLRILDVSSKAFSRISRSTLDTMMTTLEVSFVRLTECLISPGWRLTLGGTDAPAIHYNLGGTGRMIVEGQTPIDLAPHTLVILPAGALFMLEGPAGSPDGGDWSVMEGRGKSIPPDTLRRFVAGEGEPRLMMICGYFNALYGNSIDLFGTSTFPIVEQFDAADQLDQRLKAVLAELAAKEVGMGAMTAALLKVVLLALLRRSLSSLNIWGEQLSVLGDPQIARAFIEMAGRLSTPHTIQSLSHFVGLSRSVFMARFTAACGESPMAVLRQLRMRHAAVLLSAKTLTIDQIAYSVGYQSRSSFSRAFRLFYGRDPSEYRATMLNPTNPHQEQKVVGGSVPEVRLS
jgi:AraC family transcriptional activator of mtrCDE